MQGHRGAGGLGEPFLGVRFRGGAPGESVRVVWVDNQGGVKEVRSLSAEQKTEGAL